MYSSQSTRSLPDLFELVVHRTPDATAVIAGEVQLSYRELNDRADRMADSLVERGVGAESAVGLWMRRSVDLVVAALGVVKAGGAYVPLDDRQPAARLRRMLEETGITVLITDGTSVPPADLDLLDVSVGRHAKPRLPAPMIHPERLAYLMYTSGSTGAPQGIGVPHRAVADFALDERWRNGHHQRVLMHSPTAFDASTYELWVPLLNGGTVVVAPPGRLDVAALHRVLVDHDVTAVFLTAALFDLVAEQRPECLSTVREVWAGGERVPPHAVLRVRQACPSVSVVNVYGPTETTTFATSFTVPAGGVDADVPIGHPMNGIRAQVLDEQLRPLPADTIGELYLAGTGLARGYHHQPALTAHRFVADCHGPPGSRLYRTGDLVHYSPAGELHHHGRVDGQVKIRGHRIEPAEIEAVLTRHPAIARGTVTHQDNCRTAYCTPKENAWSHAEQDELVEEWQQIYDTLYDGGGHTTVGTDFSGWNSSYDGRPFSLAEMEEWRDVTVDRIRELRPRRVLEIGVGTGLLLSRLAPECESYWGTDFSHRAVEALRCQVAEEPRLADRVEELSVRPATDVDGLPEGTFDTVIINSVSQYFPSDEYLAEVLGKAVGLLAPGGAVFVGDVRNLRLQRCFHTEVVLRGNDLPPDRASVRALIDRATVHEQELLVDPEFFAALRGRVREISDVDVQVKHAWHRNEMSQYRYDVLLRTGPCEKRPTASSLRWGMDIAGLTTVVRHLEEHRPTMLHLEKVPNARVMPAVTAARLLAEEAEVDTARQHLLSDPTGAPDPEELREIGKKRGYQVSVTWSAEDGSVDVLFQHDTRSGEGTLRGSWPSNGQTGDLSGYTNDPRVARNVAAIIRSVRQHLSEHLPEYMVPRSIVLLNSLPLTINGKIDHQALPAPDPVMSHGQKPSSAMEHALCAQFAEVLAVPQVSRDDSFFALGGDSLGAIRLSGRIPAALGIDVPARLIFEAPTAARLAQRLGDAQQAGRTRPRLRPLPRPDRIPLSPAQRRLWFLDRLEQSSPNYNVPFTVRLSGDLDREALAASLCDVVARHESLRTVFAEDAEGGPHQVVLEHGDPRLVTTMVSEEELPEALRAAGRRGFDLSSDLPLRAELFRLEDSQHVLLIVAHHIACDGWSLAPFWHDLATAYAARRAGHAPGWTPLPVQYADYALWQDELLHERDQSDSGLRQRFRSRIAELSGLPEHLRLPTRPRPSVARHRGEVIDFEITRRLHRALTELAREHDATLFMALHAGLAALLTKLGGGQDVPLGSPVANRCDPGLDDLIGFFVNTVVLRADTSGDPRFGTLLDHVRDTDLAAFADQDLPFEWFVDALNPDRTLAHHPLFQVMLALQNTPTSPLRLPGLDCDVSHLGIGTSRFDLAFSLTERHDAGGEPAGVTGRLEYDTDLFDPATADAVVHRWIRLLEAVTACPDLRLSEVDIASGDDRRRLPETGSNARGDIPDQTFPALFEAQVSQNPDAPAVVFGGVEVSYQELNARANRLARHLTRHGAGRERFVATAVPRSTELIVAVLAVMKSGAAYVPIDPDYPPTRRTLMLADSRAVAVITTSAHADIIPDGVASVILDDPRTRADLETYEETDLRDRERTGALRPDNAAYLIYTSGSTGRPKGVVVTHTGIPSMVATQRERFGVDHTSRILQFASISFDGAVWEICGALATGAALVVATAGDLVPGSTLALLCARERVTHAVLPPAVLAVQSPADLPGVAWLISSGETLPGELARRWCAGRNLINGYGPTEDTVCATLSPPLSRDAEPAIGGPILNTQALVLDDQFRPVPPGIVGELYLAGSGLARGYHDQPAHTAHRFVANPYGPPGTRLYRTGDLTHRTPTGELHYDGRTDQQIKIRGHRIEPTEIDTFLTQHPSISHATTTRHGNDLAAYCTPQEPVSVAELRTYLAARLPNYLVPSAIVLLDAFPLTPSGKVDHASLPTPDFNEYSSGRRPRSSTERVLCALFSEVLGIRQATVDDGFFALGGHSLLVPPLLSRIRTQFGLELPARAVFEYQTVAELAEAVDSAIATHEFPPTSAFDLRAEADLDADIVPEDGSDVDWERNADPEKVLITGATGFLGAFLLHELLTETRATVHCLVRARDAREAAERLHRTLREYRIDDIPFQERIVPVAGDLELPLLGLSPDRFDKMGHELDAIYHCGARVSAVAPVEELKTANAAGTQEILRLAACGRTTPLHHVSTAAVAVATTANPDVITEDRWVEAGSVLTSGYVATKWLAEHRVHTAARRGLTVTIHRPGRISGHSHTGASPTHDTFWQLLRAMLTLGVAPALLDREKTAVDLIPVDHVATALVHLARRTESAGRVHHLTTQRPIDWEVIRDVLKEEGYELHVVPDAEWLSLLRTRANHDSSLASAVLLADTLPSLLELARLRFDQANAHAGLAGAAAPEPTVDHQILHTSVRHFMDSGFFPPPPRTTADDDGKAPQP